MTEGSKKPTVKASLNYEASLVIYANPLRPNNIYGSFNHYFLLFLFCLSIIIVYTAILNFNQNQMLFIKKEAIIGKIDPAYFA
jgi:hypothetical protein